MYQTSATTFIQLSRPVIWRTLQQAAWHGLQGLPWEQSYTPVINCCAIISLRRYITPVKLRCRNINQHCSIDYVFYKYHTTALDGHWPRLTATMASICNYITIFCVMQSLQGWFGYWLNYRPLKLVYGWIFSSSTVCGLNYISIPES